MNSKQSKTQRNLTEKLFNKFLIEWVVISAVVAVIIVGYIASTWNGYSYFIYDGVINLMAQENNADADVVIVTIDEKSINALGRWPWSREYHAQLVDVLQAAQPQVLGFSILFTELGEDKESDFLLKKKIETSNFPVVMPVLQKAADDFYFSTPNTLLSTVDMYADPDGVIRRLKLMYNKDDFYLPQLSLQAYWAAQHTDFSADNIYDDILINYSYKSRQGFKEISYIDVLQGQYNKEDLHGKIILVGVTAAGLAGNVATPLSNTHHAVHVHAQVINNILNDSFIFKVSAPQDFYINLSVVFVFLLTVFLAHKIHLLYVATTFSALLIVASIVLFKFGIWWSPLSCIIVFFISWIIWSWRRSLAVIAWCRHSLNRFNVSQQTLSVHHAVQSQRLMLQDRFQFELRLLENMLVSAQNIESQKTKLRTYLSHDLRSPQASMMALVRRQSDPHTALPQADFYRRLEQLVGKSLGLLDDLLVLSRSEAEFAKFEPVLLAAVVQDALDDLWPQFVSQQIEVVFATDNDELGEILGDAKMLLRAIANILDNSIKYAGQGATINLSIDRCGTEIVLTIADNGPGFSSGLDTAVADSNHLAYTSYGLGLELVDTVVKSHGARLHSQILEGQGAVFTFNFPALAVQAD